tara:strand:- start:2060 stop:2998 length:939 start_codon:yes stop_codon:yes gene_type:complete
MSSTTLKGFKDEIDNKKINISSLRKLDSGGQMATVSYGEKNNKFIVQTPLMNIPYSFGIGYNGERSDYLNVSFGDYTVDTKLKKFYENMKDIENTILEHVVKNVESWFPNFSGKSEAVVEQLIGEAFNRFIRHSKDDKYPPTIKVKIPYENGKYNISIVDMHSNVEYDFNEIKDKLKGAFIKICFRVNSVYFINKHFGITAKATKIKISFPVKDEDDFRSDSEDEDTVVKKMSNAVIEDDDIDDEIRKEFDKKNTKENVKESVPQDSEEEKEEEKEESDDNSDNSDDSDEPVKKPAVIKKTAVKAKSSSKKK